MRKLTITGMLLLLVATLQAQDEITGIWMTHEANSKIEIYEKGGQYFGKVVWLEEPNDRKGNPKTDRNNPDRSLRGRTIIGSDMLTELRYENGAWTGKIYAARQGRTMDVTLRTLGADELELQVSFRGFTREKKWTRDAI